MKPGTQLFFIALLPPDEVQQAANEIKHHFAEVYHSRAAFKSPPHITLQPPFEWATDNLTVLSEHLSEFAQNHAPIPLVLDGFAAFKPRVIFINVLKTPELLALQKNLSDYLESSLNIVHLPSKNRPFSPHLTVAYKDLTKANFYKAWPEFAERSLHFEFTVPQITLLIHQEKKWQIKQEFSLVISH
ncbi:2'-5' RNA ligase family protein [Gloeothece verrucosa]|uniref:Phosphoesterase HXTX n=1 Tax=Gloeothece verrucosa (strain PCC 7822) TaxID=497965 RepID=E0U5N9_GLOV7|nr:2'-5' RNA ligase family protein [Gloeothece verrucosa]ADN14752.1 Phosphoesterase HXTX [Gloeothece verrucosa PCC 7822]